jgi:hypothetical protein
MNEKVNEVFEISINEYLSTNKLPNEIYKHSIVLINKVY